MNFYAQFGLLYNCNSKWNQNSQPQVQACGKKSPYPDMFILYLIRSGQGNGKHRGDVTLTRVTEQVSDRAEIFPARFPEMIQSCEAELSSLGSLPLL